jgi:hypothetical protein
MALDPSIALDVQQPQSITSQIGGAVDVAKSLQSISASQTQQQATQAAIPGIVADSAIKARAAAFNKWQSANASNFVSTPTDEAGQPIKGAPPIVDHQGFATAAANAGYYTEAQAVLASDLKNQASSLSNQADATALSLTTRGSVATMMDAFVKNNPGASDAQVNAEYNRLLKGVGDQFKGSAAEKTGVNVASIFGPADNADGTYNFDRPLNAAYVQATMNPLQQADLKLRQGALAVSQEQVAQAGEVNQAGAAYRNPDSPQTAAARKAAIAADPAHADQYSQMTASQLQNSNVVGGVVKEALVPGTAKAGFNAKSLDEYTNARIYDNAQQKLTALATSGLTTDPRADNSVPFTSMPAQWIKNNLSRFAGGPGAGLVLDAQQAFSNANRDPSLGFDKLDSAALADAMHSQASLHYQLGDQYQTASQQTAFVPPASNSTSPVAGGVPKSVGATEPTSASNVTAGASTKPDLSAERAAANKAIANGKDSAAVRARFKQRTGQDL